MSETRNALERVPANFQNAITGDEETGFEAAWLGPNATAGLRAYGRQVAAFIEAAEAEIPSISAATDLLQGVFEDR